MSHLVTLRDLDPPTDPLPGDTSLRAPVGPGQYVPVWSTIVSVSWGLIISGLVALASTSVKIGKPTFWVGDQAPASPTATWLVPFALPAAALLGAAWNRRWTLAVSALASVSCLAVGWADLADTPGVALGELAMGVAGALVTAASLAGRIRPG